MNSCCLVGSVEGHNHIGLEEKYRRYFQRMYIMKERNIDKSISLPFVDTILEDWPCPLLSSRNRRSESQCFHQAQVSEERLLKKRLYFTANEEAAKDLFSTLLKLSRYWLTDDHWWQQRKDRLPQTLDFLSFVNGWKLLTCCTLYVIAVFLIMGGY